MLRNNDSAQALINDLEHILGYRLRRHERESLMDAYEFACNSHTGQFRDSGEPFISHPIEVAKILANLGADVETIISGLLHDVVEECNIELKEIQNRYGETFASIVDGVTKISNLKLNEKLEAAEIKSRMKVETIRKMLIALSSDPRIIIVKLADRLHNMRTLNYLKNSEKRKEKASETLKIYAPIANRIGMHKLKWELEDLSFKYLYPEQYQELKQMLNRKLKERQETMDEYKKIVNSELRKNKIEFQMEGRVKHLYSIWRKMLDKGRSFDELFDLIALRVITTNEVNCYKILGIVHSLWPPMPGRFKDYIAAPKSNGYQSLHTTLITHRGEPLEIQIRSEKMHTEAEYGLAAHWIYKEDMSVKRRSWLTQLNSWHKDFIDNFNDMDSISSTLASDEVFVFTPKGEIFHLPRGATPIDFAYSIHTEIGHHFAGAKVNSKLVPIDYQLQLGDRIEILVNKASEGPSLDWLKYAKSNSTRAKIRKFFKTKYSTQLVEQGRDTFRKVSKKLAKPMEDLLDSEEILEIMERLNVHGESDFFLKIGEGTITMAELLNVLYPKKEETSELPETTEPKQKQRTGNEVIVGGQTGIDVYFAKCCTPLPGDDIVAIISSRGISIHNKRCSNIDGIPSDKILEANWSQMMTEKFVARIVVDYDNRENQMAGKLLEKVESRNAKITKYSVEAGKWGYNTFIARVLVKDLAHLTSIMESLRSLKGVQSVTRTGGMT